MTMKAGDQLKGIQEPYGLSMLATVVDTRQNTLRSHGTEHRRGYAAGKKKILLTKEVHALAFQ